ncbi:MAG: class II glutamine amidotransferase, partial [Alphaproteobacteria bacterium]|nr:class II glutamine amidotransferase [Alphaproteobacteria bacterium]
PKRTRALWHAVGELAERVNGLGIFNLLLSDSRCLYGYCSTELAWLTRKAPFGKASLIDTDLTVDFSKETTSKDIVTVIATRPLTRNEEWTVMKRDSLVVFRKGEPVFA